MRIHIATHLFAPRPQGAFCAELASHWARAGHQVVVFTADPAPEPDASPNHEIVGGLPLSYDRRSLPHRLASRLAFGGAAALASARRGRPDVFLSAGLLPLVGTRALAPGQRRSGAARPRRIAWLFDLWPDVLAAHRPDSLAMRWVTTPLSALADLALKQADDLVTISPHMTEVIGARAATGRGTPRIHTVPLWATEGPDRAAHQMAGSPGAPLDAATRAGTPPPLRAMYHGNLGLSYDFEPVLAAAARLPPEEVTFVLVGEGAQRDMLARRIQQDALTNVELRPPVEAAAFAASLESADVHLLPLRQSWDGVSVPSKLLPYLAIARPIVVLGAPEGESAALVRESGSGVVVGGAGLTLEAVLRDLRRDPASRAAMAAAGRDLYLKRFSAARAFAAWDALIGPSMTASVPA